VTPPVRQLTRNLLIVAVVVLVHVAALWALQTGLVRRAAEVVVPVAILSAPVAPPVPEIEPPPPTPQPKRPPQPAGKHMFRKAERNPPPARKLVAVPEPAPVSNAPPAVPTPQPAPAPLAAAGTGEAVAPPAPPSGPAKVELPSSNASYLQNPAPVYPPISKRLGEQGRVLVRVLIGPDGRAQKAELKRSSGFDRLDRSALEYVMKCRYVPGKVGGVPQAMWYEAPVSFVLE
jgi:protein TonB